MGPQDRCPFRFPFPTPSDDPLSIGPEWAEIQRAGGIAKATLPDGHEAWIVAGHEAVRTVLQDVTMVRGGADGLSLYPGFGDDFIVAMDGDELRSVRGLVGSAFSPASVAQRRDHLQALTDALLDELIATGPPADLASTLGLGLTLTTIADVLGVPAEDRPQFKTWSDAVLLPGDRAEEMMAAVIAMSAYLEGLIVERQTHPADDVLSEIARRGQAAGVSLTRQSQLAVALFVGGWETTAAMIGKGTYRLVTTLHPEAGDTLYRYLHDHPDLIDNAVDEILRISPSSNLVTTQPRRTTRDVEIAGVTIRAGEYVLPSQDAASRDPAVFERPDRFDIHRENADDHLVFGAGPHVCIGSHLARLELRVVFRSLIGRLPSLRLAVPAEELKWNTTSQARRLAALPVTWDHSLGQSI
jgi:nocardicin N-oxygenase